MPALLRIALALACVPVISNALNDSGYRWNVPPKGEFCFFESFLKGQHFQLEYIVWPCVVRCVCDRLSGH